MPSRDLHLQGEIDGEMNAEFTEKQNQLMIQDNEMNAKLDSADVNAKLDNVDLNAKLNAKLDNKELFDVNADFNYASLNDGTDPTDFYSKGSN